MTTLSSKIWFGNNHPAGYVSLSLDFINTIDTRISALHYQKYDEINFTESCISDHTKWPIILDELFKLSTGMAKFTLKFNSLSTSFSIAKFYKQIFHLSDGNVQFLSIENDSKAGIYTINFLAKRRYFDNSKDWSFGIIWDGKNEGYLYEYIDSIKKIKYNDSQVEILICGPQPSFKIDLKYKLIETDQNTELFANISRKKNLIINQAEYENICIAHNRYKLNDNFIKSFDKFHHDYDFCVVKQVLLDTGERVPDWVSQASDEKLTANYLLPYGVYSPFQYIPGGLIIGKKHILNAIPFNELATWNMAEDVELSQRLRESGFLPRLNSRTVATVLNLRKEIITDFKDPDIDFFYKNLDLFHQDYRNKVNKYNFLKRNITQLIFHPRIFVEKLKSRFKV